MLIALALAAGLGQASAVRAQASAKALPVPSRPFGAGPGVTSPAFRAAIVTVDALDHGALAGSYKVGPLVVSQPWSRATPGGAKRAAGYLRIANTGNEPDRLIGGSAQIAGQLEIHASDMKDGVMRMRTLREGIEIPPGETIEFRPGGKHLMFARLEAPIRQGSRFKATLVFEKAGPVDVEFSVRGLGTTEADEGAEPDKAQ